MRATKDPEIIAARFGRAVMEDHGACADAHCDIAAALRAGYPRVAAYLLNGATETPYVDAVMQETGETFDAFGHATATDQEWLEWIEWFHANTIRCSSCGAFNFTDDGPRYSCGNCLAVLSASAASDDDDS